MGRRLWMAFVIAQVIGVSLATYSSRFEVGLGGAREFLWIPATLVLFPGIFLGYGINAIGIRLDYWYGLPFYAAIVLVNAGFWSIVVLMIRRLNLTRRAKA